MPCTGLLEFRTDAMLFESLDRHYDIANDVKYWLRPILEWEPYRHGLD